MIGIHHTGRHGGNSGSSAKSILAAYHDQTTKLKDEDNKKWAAEDISRKKAIVTTSQCVKCLQIFRDPADLSTCRLCKEDRLVCKNCFYEQLCYYSLCQHNRRFCGIGSCQGFKCEGFIFGAKGQRGPCDYKYCGECCYSGLSDGDKACMFGIYRCSMCVRSMCRHHFREALGERLAKRYESLCQMCFDSLLDLDPTLFVDSDDVDV